MNEVMPLEVSIRLTHASLQAIAEDCGVDILHVKGPAVDPALLETVLDESGDSCPTEVVPRSSIDADVLVRPGQVGRFIRSLQGHHWSMVYRFQDGSAFEHAASLAHPLLANVDLHRRFPGLSRDPETSFDRLWAERELVEIAGYPCPVPSLTAQRLILLLHAARSGAIDSTDVRTCWEAADDAQRHDLLRLADELGAEVALASVTGRLEDYADSREYALWKALTEGDASSLTLWRARVAAAATWTEKVQVGATLVLPRPGRLAASLGRAPTTRELAGLYLERARSGVRELMAITRRSAR